MNSSVPTLTRDGFVTNKHLMLVKLWEYFLCSDYSQSNTFYKDIASLKYLLTTQSITSLKDDIETTLRRLYGRYYDNVTVDVEVVTNSKSSDLTIHVDMTCTDDEKYYRLNEQIETNDGKIKNFDELLDNLYAQYNNKE